MESTQLASQLPNCVVTVLVVIVPGVGNVETVVIVEKAAVLLAVLVVVPVLVMLVVLLVLLTLVVLDVLVVTVLAAPPPVVDAVVLNTTVLLALVPAPIHPTEPAMHGEKDATLGPTNQSSPNCPLYGSRYEEALEGRWAMPEIATIGLGLVGPAVLTILISAHCT